MDDINTVGKKENLEPMWKTPAKRDRLGISDFFAESSVLGVAPREELEVDHHAVQAKADLFRRIPTTEVTDETPNKKQIPLNRSTRAVST